MLNSLTLDDKTGTAVPLMSVSAPYKREVASVTGLLGISTLRDSKRVLPNTHGSISETRYEDGRLIAIEGQIASNVSLDDMYSEWRTVIAPMLQTLDSGPALMKWDEGAADAREGLLNQVNNPYGVGLPTQYTAAGSVTMTSETDLQTNVGSQPFPNCNTAVKAVTTADAGRPFWLNAVTNGEGLSFTVWVKVTSLTATNVIARIRNASDTIVASSTAITVAGGAWQVLSVTTTANASAGWKFSVEQTGTGGATYYATGWTLVRGVSFAAAPFDLATDWTQPDSPNVCTQTFKSGKQRLVKLDSDVDPVLSGQASMLNYQAHFFAEDPRAYAQALTVSIGNQLSALVGGLTFPMKLPVTLTSSAGGTATFYNQGNRPTPPVFRVYGMCQNFQIVNISDPARGRIVVNGTVQPGDWLELDTQTRTLTLVSGGLRSNAAHWLDVAQSQWFDLPTGSTDLQLIASNFTPGVRLYTYGRGAYA